MVFTPAPARTMILSCFPASIAFDVTSVDRTIRMPMPSSAAGGVSWVSFGLETISRPRTLSSSRATVSILSARSRRMAVLIAVLALGVAGCASDHHVSPWGEADRVRIGAFAERPDLATHLASIERETKTLGLRSEEHTSELQSLTNLVCRLLLEKKKHNN